MNMHIGHAHKGFIVYIIAKIKLCYCAMPKRQKLYYSVMSEVQ